MMKGSMQEEEFTLINIDASNIGTPKYIKGEIYRTIIVETLTPHSHQWTDLLDSKATRQQRP